MHLAESATAAAGARLLALVVDSGPATTRGLRLNGRSLVAHALETLTAVPALDVGVIDAGPGSDHGRPPGVTVLASDEAWRPRAAAGLLLHDARCPLLPPSAVQDCLDRLVAEPPGTAVVGVRPVTDTIKEVTAGALAGTVDRDSLAVLASPVVVGGELLDPLSRTLPLAGDLTDLPAVVQVLGKLGDVVPVQVPSSGRRVSDDRDVELLECLHELRRTLRER